MTQERGNWVTLQRVIVIVGAFCCFLAAFGVSFPGFALFPFGVGLALLGLML